MSTRTNLQTMRRRAGYRSAREFAEHMGLSVATYTKYEQGISAMTLLQAWRFADELGCTIDEIAGRKSVEMSTEERAIIDTYRAADDRGKSNITTVIEMEARYMDEAALKNAEGA